MNPRIRHRSDANQEQIVDALRRVGVQVEVIGKPLDLLIHSKNGTALMEVKNPNGGRLTKDQVEFIARWAGKIHVVETVEEALQAAIGPY
jgi:hypothetical protein